MFSSFAHNIAFQNMLFNGLAKFYLNLRKYVFWGIKYLLLLMCLAMT